jgi:hypothetical protein
VGEYRLEPNKGQFKARMTMILALACSNDFSLYDFQAAVVILLALED